MTAFRVTLIRCDGCGEVAPDEIPSETLTATQVRKQVGWATLDGGDLCEDCAPEAEQTWPTGRYQRA